MSGSEYAITIDDLIKLMGTEQCPAIVDVRRKKAFEESEKVIAGAQWRDHEQPPNGQPRCRTTMLWSAASMDTKSAETPPRHYAPQANRLRF